VYAPPATYIIVAIGLYVMSGGDKIDHCHTSRELLKEVQRSLADALIAQV
jgi:hypothetical protein